MKKLWVIGIICLLFGVGVYPAVAVETDSQVEGDCGCEEVDSRYLDKIGVLIDRFEDYSKFLLLSSRSYPVVYSKCLELSNEINSMSDTYEELSSTPEWEYPVICSILESYINLFVAIKDLLIEIFDFFYQFFPLFKIITGTLAMVLTFMILRGPLFAYIYGADFGCW